jgi:hypothetical protein
MSYKSERDNADEITIKRRNEMQVEANENTIKRRNEMQVEANENTIKRRNEMQVEANEITINGVTYIQKGCKQIYSETGDIRIVILQRGWVMIGRYEYGEKKCKLHNAMVIRSWGTTKGLGELAAEGPKESTKLDPTNGLVEFHPLTEVATIVCNEEKWKHHLK